MVKYIVAIVSVLFSLMAVWVLFLAVNYQPSAGVSPEVIYVFPDGFRGVAQVRYKRREGIAAEPINNVIMLRFPSSGVLDVRGELPEWHRTSAKFVSGTPIPVAWMFTEPMPDDSIAVHRLLRLENEHRDYIEPLIVGTHEETMRADNQRFGFQGEMPNQRPTPY